MTVDITQRLSTVESEPKPAKALALYVKDTGSPKGRGVFAGRRFSAGELVESAPIIMFEAGMIPRVIANILYDLERHTGQAKARAIALGYGSLYNHDNPANLKYLINVPAKVIRFVALRDIATDEELTINYNHASGQTATGSDAWFKDHQVKPYSRMLSE